MVYGPNLHDGVKVENVSQFVNGGDGHGLYKCMFLREEIF